MVYDVKVVDKADEVMETELELFGQLDLFEYIHMAEVNVSVDTKHATIKLMNAITVIRGKGNVYVWL